MSYTTRLPALALLAAALFSTPSPAPVGAPSPADVAVIEWAQTRFAEAGLTLPEIEFVVFDDLADCQGHVGMYYPGRQRLELCQVDRESVLHELAHAWADVGLSDATRQAFVADRRLGTWNDWTMPWDMRATEHAAEIIVWALMETDTTVRWVTDGVEGRRLLTIPDSNPERLAEGFTLLTGQPVPGFHSPAGSVEVLDYSPEARRP